MPSKISQQIEKLGEEIGPLKLKLEASEKALEASTTKYGDFEDLETDEAKAELEILTTLTDEAKELRAQLAQKEATRDSLKKVEAAREFKAVPAGGSAPAIVKSKSLGSVKKADGIVKMAVVQALAHIKRQSEASVLDELYGDDERTKAIFRHVTKTAAPVATTTDANYATELVQEDVRGLLEDVESASVAAALALWAARSGGMLLNFGGADTVRIPKLAPTGAAPTEPAWVREGGAIPVGSFSVGSAVLSRYKLAEILVTTMELKGRSVVDIEALFRRVLERAYAKVLDNALLDASAAVAGVRPAGLLNGITPAAGDATGGLASVTADIAAMEAELLAANEGAVPVLLLNNTNRRALSFLTNGLGMFVFAADLQSGRVLQTPIVSSGNVPVDTAIMVDASSLIMALDAPMFDISQVATIVMADADDTAPTMADDGSTGAVGTAGQVPTGVNVVPSAAILAGAGAGYGARSMFQTWSEAVRMIAPTSFALLRPGTVAKRTAIQWT